MCHGTQSLCPQDVYILVICQVVIDAKRKVKKVISIRDVILGSVVRKILFKEVTFKQKYGGEGRKMEMAKGIAKARKL